MAVAGSPWADPCEHTEVCFMYVFSCSFLKLLWCWCCLLSSARCCTLLLAAWQYSYNPSITKGPFIQLYITVLTAYIIDRKYNLSNRKSGLKLSNGSVHRNSNNLINLQLFKEVLSTRICMLLFLLMLRFHNTHFGYCWLKFEKGLKMWSLGIRFVWVEAYIMLYSRQVSITISKEQTKQDLS